MTVTKWWDAEEPEQRKTLEPTTMTIDLSHLKPGETAHVGAAIQNSGGSASVVPVRTGSDVMEVSREGSGGLRVKVSKPEQKG